MKVIKKTEAADFLSFVRELRVVSGLPEHPNLIMPTHVGINEEGCYLALPLTLGSLDQTKVLPSLGGTTLVRIASHLMAGLSFLHSHGVLHNDVKFQNILISQGEGGLIFHLTDFGISIISQGAESDTTEAYKSPTYILSHVPTPESDFWALGKVLHQLHQGKGHDILGYGDSYMLGRKERAQIVKDMSRAAARVYDSMGDHWIFSDLAQMLREVPTTYPDRTSEAGCSVGIRYEPPPIEVSETSVSEVYMTPISYSEDVPYDEDDDPIGLCGMVLRFWQPKSCSPVSWYVQQLIRYQRYLGQDLMSEDLCSRVIKALALLDIGSKHFFYERLNVYMRYISDPADEAPRGASSDRGNEVRGWKTYLPDMVHVTQVLLTSTPTATEITK